MAILVDHESEYKGEKVVREAFGKYFSDRTIIYNNREVNGREYDICVLYEETCIFIIEVKGWLENKISVHGIDKIEIEGYPEFQKSPKKQAKGYAIEYLNKMKRKFGKSPLIIDLVAYPFISKDDYLRKKLDIVSEEQFTILKEDLENVSLLKEKLEFAFVLKKGIKHEELNSSFIHLIRMNEEAAYVEEKNNTKEVSYSVLRTFPNLIKENEIQSILEAYFAGTKWILFFKNIDSILLLLNKMNDEFQKRDINPGRNLRWEFQKKLSFNSKDAFMQIFNFDLYLIPDSIEICNSIEIKDGQIEGNENELNLLGAHTSFNIDQYNIEHANPHNNILVEAGAGTGKTYSMISRISYLCNKLNPEITDLEKDLVMVTFTNKAADNMKSRLKQLFLNYFILTGNTKYLDQVETINNVRINTIHKYVIDILRKNSLYTGLSKNFQVANNGYLRGKIYDEYLNEYLENEEQINEDYLNTLVIPVFQLKKRLIELADQFWQKNIDLESITDSKLGRPVNNVLPDLNKMILNIIVPSEREYIEELKNKDQIDLKTCIIELYRILNTNLKSIRIPATKYMFIDEFQDTDDLQIELFTRIQKKLKIASCFFVVGDIKQNIYRFRGAKMDVFDVFKRNTKYTWDSFTLNINYRSDHFLLKEYENVFNRMKLIGNLPYDIEKDCLISYQNLNNNDNCFLNYAIKKKDDYDAFFEIIKKLKREIECEVRNTYAQGEQLGEEKRTIAILVRENWEVERITLEGRKRSINIETNLGENIFKMQSTLDLYKLVLALQNSKNEAWLVNLIESNYCQIKIPYYDLSGLETEEKINILESLLNDYLVSKTGISWDEVLIDSQQSIVSVIRKLHHSLCPENKFSNNAIEKDKYEKNFDYLLEKIIGFYQSEEITLNKIVKYLSINIKTGQKETGITIEDNRDPIHIICSTIHKSKGLEYGYVVLPYTEKSFIKQNEKTNVEYKNSKIIYKLKLDDDIVEYNTNYNQLIDDGEQIAEETRVLYVALTRAINKCVWIKTVATPSQLCWRYILEDDYAD